MVSQLKVNEIVKQSGSSITIGESGDTVQLGTGATQSGFGGTNTPSFYVRLSGNFDLTNDTFVKVPWDTEQLQYLQAKVVSICLLFMLLWEIN